MTSQPEISIVTPTKNRLKLLCEAIESVQAQEFPLWEHIIVDDGSGDGTADEVGRRAAADPRIRYVQRAGERAGANVCRNQGIALSRSGLIVFLDSDDLLMPGCLSRRVSVMKRNLDIDFATFQTNVFEKVPGDLGRQYNSQILGDDLLRFLYFEIPWIITAPTWRKASLQALHGFDEALLSLQDVDLHVRAIASNMRYLRFPEADHHVRWHRDESKTSYLQVRAPVHIKAAAGVMEKLEQAVRAGPGLDWLRQRAICSLYFRVAQHWVGAGDLSAGLSVWRKVKERRLASPLLHLTGAVLLVGQTKASPLRSMATRAAHKWKGCARLRTNPKLI